MYRCRLRKLRLSFTAKSVGKHTRRWLATAHKSRISICGGPRKNFLTSNAITMQNFVVVYHTVCENRRSQKFGGGWGPASRMWRGWPPRNMLLPNLCYRAIFGHSSSKSNQTSVIMAIRQKSVTPRVVPFEVTQGHWNRNGSIGHLWLPDPQWTIDIFLTDFEISGDFVRKSQIFPRPLYLTRGPESFREFCNGRAVK